MIPPTQLEAAERYMELTLLLSTLNPDSPEHKAAWQELEAIKNNNGGMPPKE